MKEANAILAIAYRDLLKLMRDPQRWLLSFVFPLVFITVLGGALQANLSGLNFLAFTFTGVFAQTLFQSAAAGVISLIEDRENDFSQEIFVSPVSRYAIILGKIVGETLVALAQGIPILALGYVLGLPLTASRVATLGAAGVVACLLGAAFGVLVLSNLSSQRTANQVFPFLIFPQFFLAGVFNPVKVLPWYLEVLSRISPMRYAVDLARNAYYAGLPDESQVILDGAGINLAAMAVMFAVFLVAGTALFVRSERNR